MKIANSFPFGDGHTSSKLVSLLREPSTTALLQRPIQMIEREAGEAGVTIEPNTLPSCNTSAWWIPCNQDQPSIDVILTVYQRSSLSVLLEAVAAQRLKPSHVWIVQNENHVNLTGLDSWMKTNPSIPVDIVSSTANTRFHGRFHIAYAMSSATYVSIWDDDILPGPGWLEFSVNFSATHNDSLVGGNGRIISQLMMRGKLAQQKQEFEGKEERDGQVDFVGHTWTIRRDLLRLYLAAPVYTYTTGEDIQLSFALQRHGIKSYAPGYLVDKDLQAPNDRRLKNDRHASYIHHDPGPRQWLLCKVIEQGFQPLECSNCLPAVVTSCLRHYETLGKLGRNASAVS